MRNCWGGEGAEGILGVLRICGGEPFVGGRGLREGGIGGCRWG